MSYHWKINGVEACRAQETLYKADGSPYDPPSVCAYPSLEELKLVVDRVRAQYPDAEIEIVDGPCGAYAQEQQDFLEHCESLERK